MTPSALFQSVNRADVGMVERRQQARFAREARPALGIGGEVRRQDLDRDVTPELGVACAIDLAHAAGAERGDDRVRAELTADHLTRVRSPRDVVGDDRRRCFEESRAVSLVAEQRLQFVPQRRISTARLL